MNLGFISMAALIGAVLSYFIALAMLDESAMKSLVMVILTLGLVTASIYCSVKM